LHPVVWDVRLLDLEHPPRDSNINRFWRAALKDPRVWEGDDARTRGEAEGRFAPPAAEQRVNGVWQRYHDEFEYDTLRSGVIPPVGDPQSTLAILRKNVETLRKWLEDARVSAHVEPLGKSSFLVDAVVDGRAGCVLRAWNSRLITIGAYRNAPSVCAWRGRTRRCAGTAIAECTLHPSDWFKCVADSRLAHCRAASAASRCADAEKTPYRFVLEFSDFPGERPERASSVRVATDPRGAVGK
jgi:hypothetical protein